MDPILGQIILWPGSYIPKGWALCDGRSVLIQQNAALFSLLGTTYGGDGRTNFNLPDLRSMVPIGVDPRIAGGVAGQKIGQPTYTVTTQAAGAITLTVANLPAHTHAATFTPSGGTSTDVTVNVSIPAASAPGTGATNTPGPTAVLTAPSLNGAKIYTTVNPDTNLKPFAATGTVNIANTGTVTNANTGTGTPVPLNLPVSVPINTTQPSMYLNYIIATEGLYPSRPD